MTYLAAGNSIFDGKRLAEALYAVFEKLGAARRILAVPPDHSRPHSYAGPILQEIVRFFGSRVADILPALGTHTAMSGDELDAMYPGIAHNLFRLHDWRHDLVTLGEVPADFIRRVSEGTMNVPWPAQVNRIMAEGGHDLILSIGQVLPHEVAGMSNYNKNIFIGTGGEQGIHLSHFLSAVHGIERVMGRIDTPVRQVLNYASENFGRNLPIVYILTVVSQDEDGRPSLRGLFIGDDRDCFEKAVELSLKVNVTLLDKPVKKVVAHLNPRTFKSAWLGNKAIYRSRMMIADGGELLILAPGLLKFGEAASMDTLIRKHGYRGSQIILERIDDHPPLKAQLGAAAHLIHGSTEGRFTVTYSPGALSRKEIEGVGYAWCDPDSALKRYNPAVLKDGFNRLPDGEDIYYLSEPALGLWACKDRMHGGKESC